MNTRLNPQSATDHSWMERFNARFNRMFNRILDYYEHWVRRALQRPGLTVAVLSGVFLASLAIYPLLGLAFFPKTDAGQFTINRQSSHRYAHRSGERIRRESGRSDPA